MDSACDLSYSVALEMFHQLIAVCLIVSLYYPINSHAQQVVNETRLNALVSTLKSILKVAGEEMSEFVKQLDICTTEIAKIDSINEQMIKESVKLTRASFSLLNGENAENAEQILLPHYMAAHRSLITMDNGLKIGLACIEKMQQIHRENVVMRGVLTDSQAHFSNIESGIDRMKAKMLVIVANVQRQRDIYRLNMDLQWSLLSMQLPVAGLRAIVYDFAKVTFGAAMNYCASNEAELFFPTSFELLEWLRDHAKEPIWYGNQSGSWCVIILPSTGESEKYECEMDAAGFICARQTSLSSANVEELVLQFAANITATMNEWSPDIWKRINDALQQRD